MSIVGDKRFLFPPKKVFISPQKRIKKNHLKFLVDVTAYAAIAMFCLPTSEFPSVADV